MLGLYSPSEGATLLAVANCSLDLDGTSEKDAKDKLRALMVELGKKGIKESFTDITQRSREIITLNNGNKITLRWTKDIRE